MQLDTIFYGNTPTDQRKYLLYLLKALREKKGYKKIIIPCVGQFTMAKVAIQAGFEKQNIYTSEISLFSCLLGYLYSGKNIEDLNFTLSESIKQEYDEQKDDVSKIAVIFYYMKLKQIEKMNKNFYMNEYYKNFVYKKGDYIQAIKKELSAYKEFYNGINFSISDLRDEITRDYDPETLVLVNPPAFANGYTKMFDFGDDISFTVGVEEFNLKKEYYNLFAQSKEKEAGYIWYKYQNVDGLPSEDVMFGKEYTKIRYDYWLYTKASEITEEDDIKKELKLKSPATVSKVKEPIIPLDYEITEKSKVTFRVVNEKVALYYRDLFAHRLGNTKAELYVLMFIDGYVFGTMGFHLAEARRLASDDLFEVFGFNAPLKNHQKANRFLMMCITTEEFRDFIYNSQKTNRFFEFKGFKTTCLSKYRKVKLNNGLLNIRDREKEPLTGMYKIVYICDFYKRSYKDCLKLYLDEEKSV